MAIGRIAAKRLVWDSARNLKVRRLRQALPSQLQCVIEDATRFGLNVVAQRKVILEASEIALAQVLMLDDRRHLLCAAVSGFPSDAPPPLIECITLLETGEWLLLTTAAHPMPIAQNELAQTFPGAALRTLIAEHQHALAYLASRGVAVDTIDDVVVAAAAAHHIMGQPARDDRRGTIRRLRINMRRCDHEGLGRAIDGADFAERVARIR